METPYNEYCMTFAQSKEYRKRISWKCSYCYNELRPIKNDHEKRALHMSCFPKWDIETKNAILQRINS